MFPCVFPCVFPSTYVNQTQHIHSRYLHTERNFRIASPYCLIQLSSRPSEFLKIMPFLSSLSPLPFFWPSSRVFLLLMSHTIRRQHVHISDSFPPLLILLPRPSCLGGEVLYIRRGPPGRLSSISPSLVGSALWFPHARPVAVYLRLSASRCNSLSSALQRRHILDALNVGQSHPTVLQPWKPPRNIAYHEDASV